MLSRKFLSILLISGSVQANWVDFRCDSSYCEIPYNSEAKQDGLEICYKEKDKKEKIKEVTWKNGIREGAIRCYQNGKLKREAFNTNDKLNGIYQEHDYDSRGTMVVLLKNNVMDGYQFHVKDNKLQDMAWCYRDGKALDKMTSSCNDEDYGPFKKLVADFKKEESIKLARQSEENSKRLNGPQIQNYRSGKKRAIFTNVDGKINGKYNFFSEEGVLLEDCNYKKDKKDGECLSYDKEGRLDKKAIFNDGILVKEDSFFDNGKLSETLEVIEKNKSCFKTFYDTGARASSYCSIGRGYGWGSDYDGKFETWYENGQLSTTGSYEKGKMIGTWETFNYNGDLIDKSEYVKGTLTKSVSFRFERLKENVVFPEKFRLIREYFPDGSIKNETELPGHDESMTKKPSI